MRKRLIFVGCFLLASSGTFATELPRGNPEEVGMSSERLQKIDDVIQEYIDADRVQGVVVGVTRRNKVVYYEAHGVIDSVRKTPMRKDTLFAMASSTKPILGVAAMMLIEEGIISPDDPVEKYLPEFKGIQVAVPVNSESKDKSQDKGKKKSKDGKGEEKKYDEEWLKENWDNLSEEEQAEVIAYYQDLEKNQVPAETKLVPANRPITIHDLLTHTAGLHTG
jgi:CubicO group peptidase (beta-lactamase class C family)